MKTLSLFLFVCLLTTACCMDPMEQAELEKLKMTFCACECCEENKMSCLRPSKISKYYKCDLSQCTEAFCEVWDKAKCQKDCFCNHCEAKLDKKDYRCMGFKNVPDHCECKEKYDCKKPAKKTSPEDIEKKMKELKDTMDGKATGDALPPKCNMPCFCKKCKKKLPRSLREDCKKMGSPASDCDCKKSTMECPDEERQKKFQKFEENRPGMEAKQALLTGADMKINPKWTAEELKSRKCTQQCFCDSCSAESEDIAKNCKKMVKEKIPDCQCTELDVKCPDMRGKSPDKDGMDTTCQLYCFCEVCQADMRMSDILRSSCHSKDMKSVKDKDCDCSKTKCDMLDKLAEATKEAQQHEESYANSEQAKKMKKGRMKKKIQKKKIWDEL